MNRSFQDKQRQAIRGQRPELILQSTILLFVGLCRLFLQLHLKGIDFQLA